jgi:transcriptional regulator with XRE-family HTH domain
MKDKTIEKVGLNLRRLRQQKGWSQAQLAELADIHPNYIGYIERGERNVTIQKLAQIAKALQCTPAELFHDIF